MLCPNCGVDNPDEAVYCGICGMPLPRKRDSRSNTETYCLNCGSVVVSGLRFCPTCGVPLARSDDGISSTALRDRMAAPPPKKAKTVVRVVICFVIVAVVGALCRLLPVLMSGDSGLDVDSAIGGFEKVKQSEISGEGYGTAEEAAQTIEAPLNAIYSDLKGAYENGADDGPIRDFAQTVYNGMPSAFTEAVTSGENMTKQEAIDEMAQGFSSSLGIEESDLEYIDKLSFTATVKLADKLDSDELDAVNEWLGKAGMVNEATAGYKIGETLTAEAVDGSVDLGDSSSQDISDIRLEVIEVGSKWFLWSSTFN